MGIWLAVNEGELCRRNLARLTGFLDGAGMSCRDYWNARGDPNVVRAREEFGEWSVEAFSRWQRERIYPCIEPFGPDEVPPRNVQVDNSDLASCVAIDALLEVLRLPPREGPVDAAKVAAVQEARLKKMVE